MKHTNESSLFMGTLFSNCTTKHGIKESIFNWLTKIKDGTYKEAVEEIRSLTAEEDSALASEKKRMLPAIVPAGVLPEGRTEATTRTG